jgi:hypothetical protein
MLKHYGCQYILAPIMFMSLHAVLPVMSALQLLHGATKQFYILLSFTLLRY